jgi:hypothetical protein
MVPTPVGDAQKIRDKYKYVSGHRYTEQLGHQSAFMTCSSSESSSKQYWVVGG